MPSPAKSARFRCDHGEVEFFYVEGGWVVKETVYKARCTSQFGPYKDKRFARNLFCTISNELNRHALEGGIEK